MRYTTAFAIPFAICRNDDPYGNVDVHTHFKKLENLNTVHIKCMAMMTFEILYDRWVGGGICAFDFLNVIKNVVEKM